MIIRLESEVNAVKVRFILWNNVKCLPTLQTDPEAALEAQNGADEADKDKDEWADVDDDEEGEEDPGEDDDDDEGWITPSNFAQKRLEMFGVEASKKPEVVKVACMTTDFAMQVRSIF